MVKKFYQFLLFGLMVFVLMACSSSGSEVKQEEPKNESEEMVDALNGQEKPEELTIWANDQEQQLEVIKETVKKFTTETGIKVNVVPFGMADQEEAISLDGPSGRGPDLFFQPGVGSLVVRGLVQPLIIEEKDLEKFTTDSLEALSYEGQLYGLPSVVETYALYYNTDRITKAPETMDDLNRIIEDQFNPTNNEYGFLYDATNFYFSYAFMSGYGGYVFGEEDFIFDIDDLGLANEGSVKAGHLISNWFKDGYFPVGLDYDNKSGLFIEGKVGAVVNGPWALNDYRDALGDSLAVSYLPRLDNGEYPRSFIGVKGWMLSQYSENPYWATQLAIFLTNDESAKSYFEATGEIPPNLAILTDETLLEDRLLSGFLTQLTRGEAFPNVAELSQVWDPMADALFFIAQGDDPKEALDEAVENIREQIELVNQ